MGKREEKMLGIEDFDDFGNLKIGFFLQFSAVYFSRFMLLGPISLLAGRRNSYDLSFLLDSSPLLMLASFPPLILLFLMLTNKNGPRNGISKVFWKSGKKILIVSGFVQMVIMLLQIDFVPGVPLFSVVILFLDALIIFLVFKSERAALVFADEGLRKKSGP